MVQPVRPQDVSGLYRQQAATTSRAGAPGASDPRDAAAGGARGGRRSDQVMLSEEARQLRRVLDALDATPDERADRIAALREQIDAGTYDRGILQIATRLVEDGNLA